MLPPSRVGYVLKRYPRLSETFIVQEILAREAAGEDIVIASLRQAGDPRFHAAIADVRAPVTWISELHDHASLLWDALAGADQELPRLRGVLAELLAMPAPDAAQALEVARWAVCQGVTHLHAHFATMATAVARAAALLTGIPYSFTAHAKDIFHADVDSAALRAKLHDAHHVVTISEYNAAWLHKRFGTAAARVHRVYNGLDPEALPWTNPTDRIPGVAFVGRLVEKKGIPDLVDAVAVLRERGEPVPLQLVGTGPLEVTLHEQVRRLGLDDLVRFHGPLPHAEVATLISHAAVFAAPCVHAADGDRDGLPTVLLEAMALGTPCVSTPVTGIPEAIEHGVTGLLVPERDAFALADAIATLVQDATLRVRLAVAARHKVEEVFNRRTQATELAWLCAGPHDRGGAGMTADALLPAEAAP
jgi:colanic acid/amylovoran biosynthesis glycosyltransferase